MTGELLKLARLALGVAVNPGRIADAAADRARRMMVLLVCGLAAGVVLLPALGCAAAGLWIFVQHRLGPVWAALITAAAFALVALVIMVIGIAASRPSQERPRAGRQAPRGQQGGGMEPLAAIIPAILGFLAARREEAAVKGKAAAADMGKRGRGFFARHKGSLLLGALAAGLILGQDLFRPGRRPRGD